MQPGLSALTSEIQQMRDVRAAQASVNFPHRMCDAAGNDDDVPHIELIDQAIASLLCARKALDLNRPQFAKADGHIEEAGRVLRELEEMPCVGSRA